MTIAEKTKLKRQAALAQQGVLPAKRARTEGASAAEMEKDLPPAEAVSSTPANRDVELVGTHAREEEELEVQESPLKRKGKKKASKKVGGAEPWTPDFGKDIIYTEDSVSKPEVAIKMARHMMLPADEDFYQSQPLGSLRKAFASSTLTALAIGSSLDAVYCAELNDVRKQLREAQESTKGIPQLKSDLAAANDKAEAAVEDAKKAKAKAEEAEKAKVQAEKEMALLKEELEAVKQQAETDRLANDQTVLEFQAALASNEATLNYWRPKICQYGYDLCLKQVLGGANPADLPPVAEVPPGWWGDERDCLPDQDFDDFPPEEAPAEGPPDDAAAEA